MIRPGGEKDHQIGVVDSAIAVQIGIVAPVGFPAIEAEPITGKVGVVNQVDIEIGIEIAQRRTRRAKLIHHDFIRLGILFGIVTVELHYTNEIVTVALIAIRYDTDLPSRASFDAIRWFRRKGNPVGRDDVINIEDRFSVVIETE